MFSVFQTWKTGSCVGRKKEPKQQINYNIANMLMDMETSIIKISHSDSKESDEYVIFGTVPLGSQIDPIEIR